MIEVTCNTLNKYQAAVGSLLAMPENDYRVHHGSNKERAAKQHDENIVHHHSQSVVAAKGSDTAAQEEKHQTNPDVSDDTRANNPARTDRPVRHWFPKGIEVKKAAGKVKHRELLNKLIFGQLAKPVGCSACVLVFGNTPEASIENPGNHYDHRDMPHLAHPSPR
ncbi:MAG: hypothetical protein NTY53_07955 [Kiritimatiellaeota bacterium]|nr:hypothetical protein [Kiritimatiellota bacterium]